MHNHMHNINGYPNNRGSYARPVRKRRLPYRAASIAMACFALVATITHPAVATDGSQGSTDTGGAAVTTTTTAPGTSADAWIGSSIDPTQLNVDFSDFEARYATLSSALTASHPDISQASLEGWGTSLSTDRFESFGSTFSLDVGAFESLSAYANEFFASGGADGRVAAAASAYSAELASVYAPELEIGTLDTGAVTVPEESMLFGLVFNQSLTGLLGDTSILDSVQADRINSPEVRAQWRLSIQDATERVNGNLTDTLVSPCYGAFMATLGGSPDSAQAFPAECDPCATAGVYLSGEMNRLLDPTYDAQYFDPDDSVVTPAEYVQVPEWLKSPLAAYDPVKAAQLEGVRPRSLDSEQRRACATSAAATTGALGGVLDEIDLQALLGSGR